MVTMPAVPPYSSATMARWAPPRRMSLSAARMLRVQGMTSASRARSATRTERPDISGSSRSRTWTKPTTSSGLPSITG